jgi:hypothetical protein
VSSLAEASPTTPPEDFHDIQREIPVQSFPHFGQKEKVALGSAFVCHPLFEVLPASEGYVKCIKMMTN